ncbi:unnamed protein product, partial [Didymodactylos carnosus]
METIEIKHVQNESFSPNQYNTFLSVDTDHVKLAQQFKKIERDIIELTLENQIFRKTLEGKKVQQNNDTETSLPNVSESSSERLLRKHSKSRNSNKNDCNLRLLTWEQKLDIIIAELEQMKSEKQNTTNIDKIELLEVRTYKREKFMYYFSERLKSRESNTNKLRDKSSDLICQIKRLEAQMTQNEENQTLNEINLSQLKIENQLCLNKIDEKNAELIVLKNEIENMSEQGDQIKIALQLESKNYQTILNNIKKQEELIDQTQQDIIYLQQEIVDAENTNKMLIGQRQNYKLSDAFSYVKKKSLFYQLQQDVQVWERKVEIAK